MTDKVNGFMVFYIDVGQLPPFKAEAFLERLKDKYKKKNKKLKESGIEAIWIPVRPNSNTRVEFFPFSDEAKGWATGAKTLKPDVEQFEIEEKE